MKRYIPLPILIMVALSATIVVGSYIVETQEYTVEVLEAIVVDAPFETTLFLYPGNTAEVPVTVTNLSDNPLPVEIDANVAPEVGILVVDPGLVSVPADAQPHDYLVVLTADTDIIPTVYALTIEIKRQ